MNATSVASSAAVLVLGTTNAGKVRELVELLAPHGIGCLSLREVEGAVEVEETGETFAENAALKATGQALALQAWVLAEDSGLVVPALGGAPGVHSARFSGPAPAGAGRPVDERNNDLLLERMTALAGRDRAAHYACHAALADPTGRVVAVAEGSCHGEIANARRGAGGFGYDALFVVPEYGRTFGEILPAVKAVISHRARALRALLPAIVRHLGALVAWTCLATGGVAAGQQPAADRAPTDEVATVGDTPIFRSELEAVLRRTAGAGQSPAAPDGSPGPGDGVARRQWLEAMAIEQLVDARLLRDAIERERITVSRTDVEMRLGQLKKQVATRGVEWQRFLEQAGREEREIREQVELEIALDLMIRPKLTPAVIAAGFDRHKRELDGTRLRVSHVVLRPDAARGDEAITAATARATAIRREIVQGTTTFAEAARRHSAGPSRARGGDLGWITRDSPFIDAFAKQAFTLAKGDVSKPFATPFGVHIVQVTAIEPGRIGLEMLRPKLESLIAGELLRETLARLRTSTPVSFSPGVTHFDPATPADGPAPRRIVAGIAPAPAPAASGPPTP